LRLAYQGEPGAYSEAAALVYGGLHVETVPCKTFDEVFDQQPATIQQFFLNNRFGYGSAMIWVLYGVTTVIVMAQYLTTRRWSEAAFD